jgi:RNA polymerase sigma-70 factor (ECF subfamily)
MTCADLPLTQLARRCFESTGNDVWEELIHRLQPVFAHAAYRVAMQWGFANVRDVDDAVQEICYKLIARRAEMRRLPEDSDEAAFAYFKVVAANCAHDYFRAKYADKRGQGKTEEIEPRLDELASGLGMKQMELQILILQVDAALIAGSRERAIFWLYYRQGFTAKEIAAAIGNELSDKGVESMIYRLTAAVRESLNPKKGESGEKPS